MVVFRSIHALVAILTCLTLGEGKAFAQITGAVGGKVTDETGKPVADAQILVDGTSLGNTTKNDGTYLIENAPVGLQDLTIQYRSYQKTRENLRILAGQTSRVDFEIPQSEGVGRLKRARLVIRDNMIPTPDLSRYAPSLSRVDISGLGVGIYPHPQLLPGPEGSRRMGRDENEDYRGVLPLQREPAGSVNVQPRLEVRDWPRQAPAEGNEPEEGRTKE